MKPTMSIKEAAAQIPCGINQAYSAAKRGDIPTIKIGKRILVLREPFERMFRASSPDIRADFDFLENECSGRPRPRIEVLVTEGVIPSSVEVDGSRNGALWPVAEVQVGHRLFALIEIEQRSCIHCHQLFQVGPYAGKPRRLDSLYCSPEHQKLHKSLKRSQ